MAAAAWPDPEIPAPEVFFVFGRIREFRQDLMGNTLEETALFAKMTGDTREHYGIARGIGKRSHDKGEFYSPGDPVQITV